MKKIKRMAAIMTTGVALTACTPQQAILLHFGNDSTARRVAECESGMNPSAVSSTNDHGLFQINATTWNKPGHHDPVADFIGRNWNKVYDPVWNAWFAKLIASKYGWQMWSCY